MAKMKNETPAPAVETPKAALRIKVQDMKQKQPFLNLDTGEEEDIVVTTTKYSVPDGLSVEDAMVQAEELVQPAEKRLAALLSFATSESYQSSKAAALASGNYLTPQVKSKIVGIMGTIDAFSEVKASECFKRWFVGYTEKKASALKLLERARAQDEFSDL